MLSATTIRVECPECGPVQVSAADLTVRVCADNQQWTYCFRCPQCGVATAHDSDCCSLERVLLVGVTPHVWRMPAELTEPKPIGPPLTLDDLLDFHLFLQGDAGSRDFPTHTDAGRQA